MLGNATPSLEMLTLISFTEVASTHYISGWGSLFEGGMDDPKQPTNNAHEASDRFDNVLNIEAAVGLVEQEFPVSSSALGGVKAGCHHLSRVWS